MSRLSRRKYMTTAPSVIIRVFLRNQRSPRVPVRSTQAGAGDEPSRKVRCRSWYFVRYGTINEPCGGSVSWWRCMKAVSIRDGVSATRYGTTGDSAGRGTSRSTPSRTYAIRSSCHGRHSLLTPNHTPCPIFCLLQCSLKPA